jgi:hypothetical protein
MTQTITYWAPLSANEFNEITFDAPVTMLCRWQDKAVLFRDSQGQEVTSAAVIYPAQPLALKGYIKKGDNAEANPLGLAGAFEIRQSGDSPNLRGTITLNKVFV